MDNKNIILALCESKKEFKPIVKNKINPHYKSEYADLQSYLDSTQDSLCKHGLFVSQVIQERGLVTTIHYAYSSDTIVSVIDLKECPTPQAFGSALTYYRRYAYSAILGLSSEDDDANESSVKAQTKTEPKKVETKTEPKKEIPIDTNVLPRIQSKFNESKDKIAFLKLAQEKLEKENQDATDYQKAIDWIIEKRNEIIKQGENKWVI